MQTQLFDTISLVISQTLSSMSLFMPKIVGALMAFVIGAVVAKIIRKILLKILHTVNFSKVLKKTPLQYALPDELGKKAEEIITGVFYWLTMLVVIHTTVSILGLTSLTVLLAKILGYIPKVISAVFILAFGILLAGWVESLVKNSIRNIDPKTSRLLGKFSSYLVIVLVALTTLSELGIASEFITILFIGMIGSLALGTGLAIGLGGKNTVSKLLDTWYENNIDHKK